MCHSPLTVLLPPSQDCVAVKLVTSIVWLADVIYWPARLEETIVSSENINTRQAEVILGKLKTHFYFQSFHNIYMTQVVEIIPREIHDHVYLAQSRSWCLVSGSSYGTKVFWIIPNSAPEGFISYHWCSMFNVLCSMFYCRESTHGHRQITINIMNIPFPTMGKDTRKVYLSRHLVHTYIC